MSQIIRLNTNIDRLLKFLTDLLRNVAEKDDEQILQIAIQARRLETLAFLVRGVCASVLRQRYPDRLPGGRGKHDHQGLGIRAKMSILAEQLGVDRRTLETDARIRDTFFHVIDETSLVNILPLRREHFVIALAAPEPQAAIKVAVEKRADPEYTLEAFRCYVRDLRRVESAVALHSSAKRAATLRVPISVEAQQALSEIVELNGCTREEVVENAILSFHRAVLRKRGMKRESSSQLRLAI